MYATAPSVQPLQDDSEIRVNPLDGAVAVGHPSAAMPETTNVFAALVEKCTAQPSVGLQSLKSQAPKASIVLESN